MKILGPNIVISQKHTNRLLGTLLICLGLLPAAYGKGELFITEDLQGHAFVVKEDKSWELKVGEIIYDFLEIVIEEAGRLTLRDQNDRQIHLTGGSHLTALGHIIELKRGNLWLQSREEKDRLEIHTANAIIKLKRAADILVTLDLPKNKTQVLVLRGEVELQNLINPIYKTTLSNGQFSYIEDSYNEGRPRAPSPVGESSFMQITSLFPNVAPLEKRTTDYLKELSGRTATVLTAPDNRNKDVPIGEIIYIPRKKPVDRKNFNYQQFLKEEASPITSEYKRLQQEEYRRKNKIQVKVFGHNDQNNHNTVVSRAPAAVPAPLATTTRQKQKESFKQSLMQQYIEQKKYDQDVSSLIQDLKSYGKDRP